MVEIHFKTFSPLAAASAPVVITAQSAPIGVVRSPVVRRGAAIRAVSFVPWSTSHSSRQAAGSVGEWPATIAAPAKAGASTLSRSLYAHLCRGVHRLLTLAQRQPHAPLHLHLLTLTARLRLHRLRARARDGRSSGEAGVSLKPRFTAIR